MVLSLSHYKVPYRLIDSGRTLGDLSALPPNLLFWIGKLRRSDCISHVNYLDKHGLNCSGVELREVKSKYYLCLHISKGQLLSSPPQCFLHGSLRSNVVYTVHSPQYSPQSTVQSVLKILPPSISTQPCKRHHLSAAHQ